MNNSLITADRATHLRVLTVALLASILVIWIGIAARWHATDNVLAGPRLEQLSSEQDGARPNRT
ncbi:MAG TPA: hypothetical protein VK438_12110 [Xanthobacteraceae bacterium]|nr:hypothetical protein [Xanthobacteraceae bacterium]